MSGTDLRDLLDRAVEPLDTMPDAVPDVLAEGRRSVRRRRTLAAAATAVGAAAAVAVVAALTGLAGGSTAEPPVAGVTTASPTAHKTVTATPSPGRTIGLTRAPIAWRAPAALVAFNRDVLAPALGEALPDRFGPVTVAPSDSGAGEFRVSVGGESYELQFFVSNRAKGYNEQIFPCADYLRRGPGIPDQYVSCEQTTLPTGVRGVAYAEKGTGLIHRAETIKDDRMIGMSLYANGGSGPISNTEMLAALKNPALSAAYREWMTHDDWMSN